MVPWHASCQKHGAKASYGKARWASTVWKSSQSDVRGRGGRNRDTVSAKDTYVTRTFFRSGVVLRILQTGRPHINTTGRRKQDGCWPKCQNQMLRAAENAENSVLVPQEPILEAKSDKTHCRGPVPPRIEKRISELIQIAWPYQSYVRWV